MNDALIRFRKNIARVRALGGIHQAIDGLTTPIIDSTDILRSQIVFVVSALDHYVHDVTRIGMLEAFNSQRDKTDAYLKFPISTRTLMSSQSNSQVITLFEQEIIDRHGYLAFQHPDKIAGAIRLISPIALWEEVAKIMGKEAVHVKITLKLIVERRNKIAHEADLDPSFPNTLWPLFLSDTDSAIQNIVDIGESIHDAIK